MLREGHKDTAYRQKVAQVDGEGLSVRSARVETKYQWAAIEKAEVCPRHLFVYVGPTSAVVVPREAVTQGSYDAFLAVLRNHLGERLSFLEPTALR